MKTEVKEIVQAIIDGEMTLDEIRFRPDIDDSKYRIIRFEYLKEKRQKRYADGTEAVEYAEVDDEIEEEAEEVVAPDVRHRKGKKYTGNDVIPGNYLEINAALADEVSMKESSLRTYMYQNKEFREKHVLKNGHQLYISPEGVDLLKTRQRKQYRSGPVKIVKAAEKKEQGVSDTPPLAISR